MRARVWSLAMLPAAACSGEDARPPAFTTAGPRDTLVIAQPQDLRDQLSILAQNAQDVQVIDQTNVSLFDGDFDCKVTYHPSLAKSWSFSTDGLALDVLMRDDLTWQDGTPVTAEDVAFTYELIADPATASPRADYVDRMKADARPRVVDPHHLVFEYTSRYDEIEMLSHANLAVLPRHLLAGADRASLRKHTLNNQAPVANGPWKVGTWEKSQRIVLEPNEKYTGQASEKPKLNRVILKVIPEYATRLLELENGSVDVMEQVLVEDADRLAVSHPEISLRRRGWRTSDTLAWNSLDPADYRARDEADGPAAHPDTADVRPHALFADREVRRALTTAIDVNKLIHDLLTSPSTGEVYGRPAIGNVTPALCGVHNDEIARLPFDPEAARKRLAELGWTDTNGDGVIDRDGRPFRFTLLTNDGNARRAKAAVIIQANLKEVGIDAQIDKIETGAFFERLRTKDYDAAILGWSAGLFPDAGAWGPDSEFNFTSYRSPELARLVEQLGQQYEQAAVAGTMKDIQATIYADQPYTFLYWMDEIVAVHSRFQDTVVDLPASYRHLAAWNVPADKVKYPN
jgi:peptide/nickel transport system substrate-binding protein